MTTEDDDVAALAGRLREAVGAFRTHADAAAAAGVSVAQLRNYLAGKHAPSVFPMARFAAASGFSLEWLVSGRGQKYDEVRPIAPGSGAEVMVVSSSPAAFARAAVEEPATYGVAKRMTEEIFGDEAEQAARRLIRDEGLYEVLGGELEFALQRPAWALFELERQTAAAMLKEKRALWPAMARAAVSAQRALVAYLAPCVAPKEHAE